MKTILALMALGLLTSCAASPTWQEMNATRTDIRESIKSSNSEITARYDKELAKEYPKAIKGTVTTVSFPFVFNPK